MSFSAPMAKICRGHYSAVQMGTYRMFTTSQRPITCTNAVSSCCGPPIVLHERVHANQKSVHMATSIPLT